MSADEAKLNPWGYVDCPPCTGTRDSLRWALDALADANDEIARLRADVVLPLPPSDALKVALEALNYITQPSMAYVLEHRRPDQHGPALAACIRTATDALKRIATARAAVLSPPPSDAPTETYEQVGHIVTDLRGKEPPGFTRTVGEFPERKNWEPVFRRVRDEAPK